MGGEHRHSRCATPLGSIALVRVQGIVDNCGLRDEERKQDWWLVRVWDVAGHRGQQRGDRAGQLHQRALLGLPTGQVETDLWGHVDIVQEEQHENELIASIRGQVDLQHQLLASQEGLIRQNDVKVAELAARVGLMGGLGVSVSQLAAMGPLVVAAPLLILGGAQPPDYEFVGQNLGMVICGHPDIVQASITNEGDEK